MRRKDFDIGMYWWGEQRQSICNIHINGARAQPSRAAAPALAHARIPESTLSSCKPIPASCYAWDTERALPVARVKILNMTAINRGGFAVLLAAPNIVLVG